MKSVMFCLLLVSTCLFAFAPQNSNPDTKFVRKAAMGGMMEVSLGRLAQTNGSSQGVKDLGTMMVNDHSAANTELTNLANSKNIAVPLTMEKAMQNQVARLSNLTGSAFDREYVNLMVKDHRKDIAEFKLEAKNGKDADIKSWAKGKIPTLQTHLQHAMDLQKSIGMTAGSAKNSVKAGGKGTKKHTNHQTNQKSTY
jgi:putative membrane protein